MKKKEKESNEKKIRKSYIILALILILLVIVTWALMIYDPSSHDIDIDKNTEVEQNIDIDQETTKVQYGTLDVELVDKEGNLLEGKMLDFIKKGEGEVLWEPGVTYQLQEVYVKNVGDLKLKYNIEIVGVDGSEKLLEVIDWTIEGNNLDQYYELNPGETSNKIILKGHMREDAGNEYQKLSLDGIGIRVNATQINNN